MSKSYVLDANAVIALLKDEEGADVIDGLLTDAKTDACTVTMNKVNLLEVYYGFYREDGKEVAEQYIQDIEDSPIIIEDRISDDIFKHAGRLKSNYRISLADAIVLAQAAATGATVVSADHHELDAVEDGEDLDFLWFR
jgi:predicted nucleic acid-binding protein